MTITADAAGLGLRDKNLVLFVAEVREAVVHRYGNRPVPHGDHRHLRDGGTTRMTTPGSRALRAGVVILVPYRPVSDRQRWLWDMVRPHLEEFGWPIFIGTCGEVWQRAVAVNDAAKKAGDWEVAFIADCDTIPDPDGIRRAVEWVRSTRKAAAGRTNSGTCSITTSHSSAVQRGVDAIPRSKLKAPWAGGGLDVVHRDAWDEVGGMDEAIRALGLGRQRVPRPTRRESVLGPPPGCRMAPAPRRDRSEAERRKSQAIRADAARKSGRNRRLGGSEGPQERHSGAMTTLLTGSAGFLGRHLRPLLVEDEVVEIDRVTGFDLTDPGVAMKIGVQEIDTVYHLAAEHFVPWCRLHPVETLQTNVGGTMNLLAGLEIHPPERIIFASSAAVYGLKRARDLRATR